MIERVRARAVSKGARVLVLFFLFYPCFPQAQEITCPKNPPAPPEKDFSGQNLNRVNFAHQDLSGADFSGATLTAVVFIHANLTGANFSNAIIADSNNPVQPTDFSFADLTGACFNGVQFIGPTYFSYATVTSADFSGTKLGRTVFGQRLDFDTSASPRPAFRKSVMNCEFIDDWKNLDLENADIHSCISQLAGKDFSSSEMRRVDFTGADLTGSKWPKADLSAAIFSNSILKNADLSDSKLYGAFFNNANLEGANLSGVFLTNNRDIGIDQAANLGGAYLKNVNLSKAVLSGADLSNASFYSSFANPDLSCAIRDDGFTRDCASAAGGTLNNTQFAGAYLYGVDFNNAVIQGVQFANAVLIGSRFNNATLSTDPNVGTNAGFTGAYLQGADLASATLDGTSLQDAFLDFRSGGNVMYLRLDGNHAVFKGWTPAGQAVCIYTFYPGPTTVPTDNSTLICPDGTQAGENNPPGCGQTDAANLHWKSPVDIAQSETPVSYTSDATYTRMASPICSPANIHW